MDANVNSTPANNTGKKIVFKKTINGVKTNDIFVSNNMLMNNNANPSNTAK